MVVSKILQKGLAGDIIEIRDPRQHSDLEILKSYFREILIIAQKYVRPSVDYEDLVAEGLIGLLDAIKRWEPDRTTSENSFRNLAIVRIKSYMFEYFLKNNTPYKIPNYMARAMALVDQIRKILNSYEYEGDPLQDLLQYGGGNFEELAPKSLVDKVKSLKERLRLLAEGPHKTYQQMVETVLVVEQDIRHFESGEEFEVSPEEITEAREWLEKFLSSLTDKTRRVLELRLQRGYTLEEIGSEVDLTRERVRQILDGAVGHLQQTRMFEEAIK